MRLWPAYPDAASALCAKLTTNMSHQQWRDWVSPDIDYIKVCPDLPGREVAIGGGPPNSERSGQLAHRFTGGGEPAQLLLPIPTELGRLGGRVR